ncbi:MAG: TetR/AcrR family transcriptional regulator [Deltaproteobacteria bacterium]|nr:TetR/AcrR family transcriptional regulator [Deltaproteobacteria bacterium]
MTTKKKAYHHGNLRPALIKAALALIAKKGPRGLTLREAARRAGVTHAAPYRHFADKAALLDAVAQEGFRLLEEMMRARRDAVSEGEALVRLLEIGQAYVAFAIDNPSYFQVMFGPDPYEGPGESLALKHANETFAILVNAVTECQKGGVIATDWSARDVALTAWSAIHGFAMLQISRRLELGGFDTSKPAGMVAAIQAMIGRGIGAVAR